MSATYVFTFGHGQTCPFTGINLLDHHVTITAPTYEQCRAIMFATFGQAWAFDYPTLDEATRGGQFPSTEHANITVGPGRADGAYEAGRRDGMVALAEELVAVRDTYNAVQAAGERVQP